MAPTSELRVSSDATLLRPDGATFGARLALVRQAKGWNVREAAREAGVPAGSWRGWELHERAPRDYVTICRRIADAAGVDLAWLTGIDPVAVNE